MLATLSFDDGNPRDADVADMLRSHSIPATFYLVVGNIEDLQLKPEIYEDMEVGSHAGGSLYIYAGLCAPGAQITIVDDCTRGPEIVESARFVMSALRKQGFQVRLIDCDSLYGDTIRKVQERVSTRRIDLLHLDADHRFACVLSDLGTYGAMVREGGVVLLHDIADTPGPRAIYEAMAAIMPAQRWCYQPGRGIGMLRMRRPE